LKINRDLIDKALNEFEAETKCTLESNFDKEKEVILEQQSDITSKIADLKHSQHQIESILDIKVESNFNMSSASTVDEAVISVSSSEPYSNSTSRLQILL
jgi:hypothetical protein